MPFGCRKELKTGNLCCPRIEPGCIKDGDKHNLFCHWQLQLEASKATHIWFVDTHPSLEAFFATIGGNAYQQIKFVSPNSFPNQLFQEEAIAAIAADWNQKNRPQGPMLNILKRGYFSAHLRIIVEVSQSILLSRAREEGSPAKTTSDQPINRRPSKNLMVRFVP